MGTEITLEEAQKVIKEYGIEPDKYFSAHFRQFMSGAEPDDNSVQVHEQFMEYLQIVVDAGLAVATMNNEECPSRQVETLVRRLPHSSKPRQGGDSNGNMFYCTECGYDGLATDMKYCSNCGWDIDWSEWQSA